MDIDGSGITTITFKTLPGWRPITTPAIKWKELSNGKYYGIDRGADADTYEAQVGIYGKESVINNFITEIEDNRQAGSHVVTLSNFFSDEHIFGENVDHSGNITATIIKHSRRRQGSWKGWGLDVTFRATSVSFTGSSSLPTLSLCDVGVDADKDISTNKYDSYNGTYTYADHSRDRKTFTGTFTLTIADTILLRNYIRNQRAGDFALSDTFGIDYPFGPEITGYPFTTKLIKWQDLGLWGQHYYKMKLTFSYVSGAA